MPPGGMPPGGMPPGGDPYGAPYPGGPQPAQPKKTSPWLFVGLGCGGLFIIGIVLVVIIVFVANGNDEPTGDGSGSDSGTSSGPDLDTDTDTDSDTDTDTGGETLDGPSGGTIGDSVEHEGIIFTPLEIEGPYSELDIEGQTFTPGGEYVVLWLEVEAAGSSASFWRDEQHLYTSSGSAIEEDYDATGAMDSMLLTLTPGSPVETAIVFDVPDADDLASIGLSAETYGGNEVEVDLN
ncbi:hypothetical protein ADL05_08635 [Nocardiopsis sp. NRRL B-16309]|nr:hypothetical protein ADL05_08635 [Nocardiopsis sp. NRRL B-16309]